MTPLPEGFVPVTTLGALEEDLPYAVVVEGVGVVVVRTCGAVHAVHNACSHADVALSDGDVEDCHIECWMHGSRFDLRTGEPDALPATRPVPVFAVHVDGSGDDAVVAVNVHLSPAQAGTADAAAEAVVPQEG